MREPTPTLEEFVYSFVPNQWFTPTLENLLYWDVKLAILVAPTVVRTAWIMYSTGATFETAAYMATDTFGWYRMFTKVHRTGVMLTSPVALVGGAAFAAHTYTMTAPPPTEALRSEPGQVSWWRSVAQSIGAGGIGVGTGVKF